MDAALQSEINSCITELRAIANELEDAASEVTNSISGMNTRIYTNGLYRAANKYRAAANKLSNIQI